DPLRRKLLNAYIDQMQVEPERGLKGSMAINLEAAEKRGEIQLSAPQRKAVRDAKEAALPARPKYDDWFKDGKNEINVRSFMQKEFLKEDLGAWKDAGFKVVKRSGDTIALKGTFDDPDGRRDPLTANVEIRLTEKGIFRDMDDPNVQIEFYSGHSNLGGNVLGALADGPSRMNGDKWVVNWMCRGQQVISDVYNRFPDAHYMTTNEAATEHGPELLQSMMTGIAGRKSYAWMAREARSLDMWEENLLIWPNDKEMLENRDDDGDGVMTDRSGGEVDRLYNVGIRELSSEARDLEPVRTSAAPEELPGEKITRGVNFLNTVLEYHLEHGADGRIPKGTPDSIHASGWFAGGTSGDVIQVTERKVGRKTHYDVKLNSAFKDQDPDALGAAIAYEFNRCISEKQGGYTEQDKLRGALLAGHYLSYMTDTYEECEDIAAAIGDRYGFSDKFDWSTMYKAIDVDHSGYATADQAEALGRTIGGADPRRG
ncbi:MAG: hypothetical protein ACYTFT_14250, partial [Planctomycetota bacterium]